MKSRNGKDLLRGLFAPLGPIALCLMLLLTVSVHRAFAQTAPDLGTAQTYAVLGASTVTNTGPSVITGDLGVSPGTAVTGFPPGLVVGGSIHAADAVALKAQTDATTAYNSLASQACNTTYGVPTDIGGLTLVPGVYCFASSAAITGALTLDAQGDPNAVFLFKVGSTLITASDASVLLINGAQQCKVFWDVGSSTTLGTRTSMVGTIIAVASNTLTTNATLAGRAIALNGAVTLDTNTVTASSCAAPPVNAPPTLTKSFDTPTIVAGGTSTLTLTLGNANDSIATLTSPLTDTLPSGVVVVGSASTTCGGTVTATAGSSSVSLAGAAIPANASCTVTVVVTAATANTYVNSLGAGSLQTSNGNNGAPAAATLTVTPVVGPPTPAPPTLGKSFSPSTVGFGGTSTLVLTLNNSNATIDNLTAPLTDQLPTGMTVNGTASTTCGGLVTAAKGSSAVTLTGGFIPAKGSCTVTVNVTGDCACSYVNSVKAGALQTATGSNAAAAVATLTISKALPSGGAPKLNKYFYPANIKPGAITTLVITLWNPNATVAKLTAPLTDHLPTGVVIAAVPTTSSTCGGTVSAASGSSYVTLTGGQIPVNGSCKISVRVTAPNAGTFVNSLLIGVLKTTNGNNTSPANATLTVNTGSGPGLQKAFSPTTIPNDGVTTLTITLKNPTATSATLTAPLIDYMPSHLVVYGTATNTCHGVVTAAKGSSKVTLTGGAIPANGSCTVTVPVTAPCNDYFNSLAVGALQTSIGNNQEPAGARLTVTAN